MMDRYGGPEYSPTEVQREAIGERVPAVSHPLIHAVCKAMDVSYDELVGETRRPIAQAARRIIAWHLHKFTRMSYPEITEAIRGNRRAHCTVHFHVQAYDRCDTLPMMRLCHGGSRIVEVDCTTGIAAAAKAVELARVA